MQLQEKFNFNYLGSNRTKKTMTFPKSSFCLISKNVSSLMAADPTLDFYDSNFKIDTSSNNNPIQNLFEQPNNSLSFPQSFLKTLFEFGLQVNNPDIIQVIYDSNYFDLSSPKELAMNAQKEASAGIYGPFFTKLLRECFKYSLNDFSYILPSISILFSKAVISNDQMFSILMRYIISDNNQFDCPYYLFRSIDPNFLSKENFSKMFQLIKKNKYFFSYLKFILFPSSQKKLNIFYNGSNSLASGFFNYLNQNINDTSIQSIFNSIILYSNKPESEQNKEKIKTIISNWDDNSYFTLKNNSLPNKKIKFFFPNVIIKLEGYSIRTYPIKTNSSHLRSWKLLGRVFKNSEWIVLDEQENQKILNEKNKSSYFPIKNQNNLYFHYFCLQQTGPNWNSDEKYQNNLVISRIEFFGQFWYLNPD